MKDREGRFVALNRQGCDYCGVKSEREALGKTDCDFFPQTRAAEYMADDRVVMKTGRSILNRVEPAPEREGSPHLVITNKIPLRDGQGRVVGVAGFSRARGASARRSRRRQNNSLAAVETLGTNDYASPLTTGAARPARRPFSQSIRAHLSESVWSQPAAISPARARRSGVSKAR
ncbi:PAS domain-containing protein [Chthoniobacter flavus]